MDDVVIASAEADAHAAQAVEQHHAELAGALAFKVEVLAALARAGQGLDEDVRRDLVDWCRTELMPHALAEEGTLYRAAAQRTEGRLLVEAMLAEHQVIAGLIDAVEGTADAVTAAVAAGALRAVFDIHLAKENDQILPLLSAAPDVSLAALLSGMHELIGGGEDEAAAAHNCTCHEAEEAGLPELDARTIPHAIRHATIFGALDGVAPGHGLVLVAPHDPLPLLAQIEGRSPGAFTIEYLERGPEAWRLSMVRAAPVGSRV